MEKASKMWWADIQDLLAWVSANIMSASGGKRVRPKKLFDRKKYMRGEKEPFSKEEREEAKTRTRRLLRLIGKGGDNAEG